jgi:hypothetical protein
MGFLQRLTSLFSSRPAADRRYLPIYVLSQRCREPLAAQVDLMNELSLAEEGGPPYFARKVLHTSGRNRCFDQVEVQLWFDSSKQVVSHEVSGGRWLSEEEYHQLLAERAAAEQAAEAAKAEAAALAAQEAAQLQKDETGE